MDASLRLSGFAGMLISILSSFEDYRIQCSLDLLELDNDAYLISKQYNVFNIKNRRKWYYRYQILAQYLVLRHVAEKPELTRCSDNIRILN